MHKVLIIDDDIKRSEIIKNKLLENLSTKNFEVNCCDNIKTATKNLKSTFYSVVFLDMALPQYADSTDTCNDAGVKLLDKISRGRLKAPTRIIGFTALNDNLLKMGDKFKELGFNLYYSPPGDISWLEKVMNQINYTFKSVQAVEKVSRDISLVTAHGILTFGGWQETLFRTVKASEPSKKTTHLPFKYTRFDLIKFIFPPLRKNIIKRFSSELSNWIDNNSTKRMIIFSHSFGTYITIKALEEFNDELMESIDLIVLSGSVLEQNYNFHKIRRHQHIKIVNDCAVHDKALLVSNALIPGTGMGGKLGFNALYDEKFVNRFFSGGHSTFFKNEEFMKKYWIPLISSTESIRDIDYSGNYSVLDVLLDNLSKVFGFVKRNFIYTLLIFGSWMLLNSEVLVNFFHGAMFEYIVENISTLTISY